MKLFLCMFLFLNRSCHTSQVQSNNNNASLQKQVVTNSNNLKSSNNNNNNNNSNIGLNVSASLTDNRHIEVHQNLSPSSTISQMQSAGCNNSNNTNPNSNKCSNVPVVPILRASDLNSSVTSSSTRRNKSSSSTSSSSSSISSSSSFSSSSSSNNHNNSKCNTKKNSNNGSGSNIGLNGVNKRLLDITLLSNNNHNEDGESSSTTDSSSSQDDCDKVIVQFINTECTFIAKPPRESLSRGVLLVSRSITLPLSLTIYIQGVYQ